MSLPPEPDEQPSPEHAQSSPERAQSPPEKTVPRTRTGAIWVAIVATVILGLFLVIFIAQNNQDVEVTFLGFEGSMPLAVALLAAAVAGAGFVVLAGTARIVQLRLVARRNRAMPPPG